MGAQRRAGQQRPADRERRGRATGGHRRLRLRGPERLRRRRSHRVPRKHRHGRPVHGAGGQQRRRGQRRPASRRRREHRLHPRRGRRARRRGCTAGSRGAGGGPRRRRRPPLRCPRASPASSPRWPSPVPEQRRLAGLAAAAAGEADGAPQSASGVFAVPEQRPPRRRPRRSRRRPTPRRAAPAGRTRIRATTRPRSRSRRWMAARGREARAAAAAARDGRARRVQPHQRRLRRRRLARLLPDARLVLGPGRVRGLRRRPGQADRLVPRPGRGRQGRSASRAASP